MTTTAVAPVTFDPQGRLAVDAISHRYWLDVVTNQRRELISVTQAIGEALEGTLGEEWWSDVARDRGSYLHTAVLYAAQNDLDVSSLKDELQPYAGGIVGMFKDEQPDIIAAEQPIFDETAGYGGQFDLLCRLRGPRRAAAPNVLDLLDAKTGAIPYTVGYQTAAYKRAIALYFPGYVFRRWAWQIKNNGTYKLEEVSRWPDARADEANFLHLLRTAQIKRAHQ